MQILEAALASALVLLSFATIVTIIMEIVLKSLRIKEEGFEQIAKTVFEKVLWPKVEAVSKKAKDKIFENYTKKVCKTDLTLTDQENRNFLSKFIAKYFLKRRERPENLSVEDFFEKLADSDIGQAIKKSATAKLDETLADLAKKYERIGADLRADFIRNSAFMTQVFGVLLAFALNLNVFTFFTAFMNDDELRDEIISQSEKILGDAEKSIEDLQAEKITPGDENQDLVKISEKLDEIQQAIKGEFYQSLPMGYDTFPYCLLKPCEDPKVLIWDIYFPGSNSEAEKKVTEEMVGTKENPYQPKVIPAEDKPGAQKGYSRMEATYSLIFWAFSVFLTGILIGLGGPFWYNLVIKLSGIVQTVRGKTPASKPAVGGVQPAAVQPATSPLVDKFSTAIDAFKLAAENLTKPKKPSGGKAKS